MSSETSKPLVLDGKDNYGRPKQDYLNKLFEMTDEELQKEAEQKIWSSAYAANNPRSDYHWQCDATHDEGMRRGKPELYVAAHKKVSAQ